MEATNIYDLIGIIFTMIFFGFLLILFFKSQLVKENIALNRRVRFFEDYIETLHVRLQERENNILYVSDSQLYESKQDNERNNY